MSKELEVKKAVIDSKTIENFLFTTETKLNDKQRAMFLQLALRNQLDPFKREIYAIPYGNDFNIVTGYQVYIQRAETTNQLNGWHCEAMRNEKDELIGAKIIIYRKDFEHPFEWEVTLKEFDKGQSSWKKMPEFMIKKVCIGQGFRLAFPNELGGLPYLQEELEELTPIEPNSELNPESKQEPNSELNPESKQEPKADIKPTKPTFFRLIKEPLSKCSEAQVKALHSILTSKGFDEVNIKKMLTIEHFRELNKGAAGFLINFLNTHDEFTADELYKALDDMDSIIFKPQET